MQCAKYWIVSNRPFQGRVASSPEGLNILLSQYYPEAPQTIYFPFWSWKVSKDILERVKCIGFHSAPLPRGKGGTPIQNMIRLGYTDTEVCAFRMTDRLDDGEILLRGSVSLTGTLGEIIGHMSGLISLMIESMEKPNFKPIHATSCYRFDNVPLRFKRINENHLLETETLRQIYDEIRMRDERNHPKTFKYHGKFKIEFTDAELREGEVIARARIFQG